MNADYRKVRLLTWHPLLDIFSDSLDGSPDSNNQPNSGIDGSMAFAQERLTALLTGQVAAGEDRLILYHAPPGDGKTRLLQEIYVRAWEHCVRGWDQRWERRARPSTLRHHIVPRCRAG